MSLFGAVTVNFPDKLLSFVVPPLKAKIAMNQAGSIVDFPVCRVKWEGISIAQKRLLFERLRYPEDRFVGH